MCCLFHFIVIKYSSQEICSKENAVKCSRHEIYFTANHFKAFSLKYLEMILPYCIYILFSHHDRKLYIGYTANLVRRLQEHTNGKSLSTKGRRPLELIYCEFHKAKSDAMRREKYFKTTPGKKAIKLMIRESLSELDYAAKK